MSANRLITPTTQKKLKTQLGLAIELSWGTSSFKKPRTTIAGAWTETFPFDGWDAVYRRNYFEIDQRQSVNYANSAITRITSFVGLENRMPKDGQPTWANIAKRLLSLPDTTVKIPNDLTRIILSALIIAPLKIFFRVIPTLAINTVKLLTEFPLTLAKNYCLYKISTSKKKSLSQNFWIGSYFATAGLLFLVRTVTSPFKNARSAYRFGHHLANGNRFLGILFASLSIAMTIAAYTVILPLGIKFVITQALPFISTHAPAVIAKGIGIISSYAVNAASAVSNVLAPAAQAVGNLLTTTFPPVLHAIGLEVSTSTMGFAAIASAAFATAGFALSRIKNWALNDINKASNAQLQEKEKGEQEQLQKKVEENKQKIQQETDKKYLDKLLELKALCPSLKDPIETLQRRLQIGNRNPAFGNPAEKITEARNSIIDKLYEIYLRQEQEINKYESSLDKNEIDKLIQNIRQLFEQHEKTPKNLDIHFQLFDGIMILSKLLQGFKLDKDNSLNTSTRELLRVCYSRPTPSLSIPSSYPTTPSSSSGSSSSGSSNLSMWQSSVSSASDSDKSEVNSYSTTRPKPSSTSSDSE